MSEAKLTEQKCVPCEGGVPPLSRAEAEKLLGEVRGWQLSEDAERIEKTFTFKDWKEAFAFVTRVSNLAEAEGHHPDVDLHWGRVGIVLTTHAIGGLSVNDFILAAKIDQL